MITSPQNSKIKWIRSLQENSRKRRLEQAFVIEGVRLVEEALASGWPAQWVLYTETLDARGAAVLEGYSVRGTALTQVTPQVMRTISDTQTPQGILAVLEMHTLPIPSPLEFVFIPDRVRDPGNLGSMLRTAAAAGVNVVFFPPRSVDAFAPKVLRGGMGAHFRLPIHALNWDQIESRLEAMQVFLADVRTCLAYTLADFRSPMALIIGGEAEGASSNAQRLATTRVHIPMPGGGESLNAAVATGVILFEAARQRQLEN